MVYSFERKSFEYPGYIPCACPFFGAIKTQLFVHFSFLAGEINRRGKKKKKSCGSTVKKNYQVRTYDIQYSYSTRFLFFIFAGERFINWVCNFFSLFFFAGERSKQSNILPDSPPKTPSEKSGKRSKKSTIYDSKVQL